MLAVHTMTPEEEEAFMTNPAAFASRKGSVLPRLFPVLGLAPGCLIPGCEERAVNLNRCKRHEAIWLRLTRPRDQ